MKLQRYCLVNDGRLAWKIPNEEGYFVRASDAEALELAVERAMANMVQAQNRCAELEKALISIFNDVDVYFGHAYACNKYNAETLLCRLQETAENAQEAKG